jgi:hypothetical protein
MSDDGIGKIGNLKHARSRMRRKKSNRKRNIEISGNKRRLRSTEIFGNTNMTKMRKKRERKMKRRIIKNGKRRKTMTSGNLNTRTNRHINRRTKRNNFRSNRTGEFHGQFTNTTKNITSMRKLIGNFFKRMKEFGKKTRSTRMKKIKTRRNFRMKLKRLSLNRKIGNVGLMRDRTHIIKEFPGINR